MELTLLLPPAEAARPRRLPVVKAALTGRARAQAVRIVWHDSLDRALGRRGLALAEQRGTWRLERHRPDATESWPPATDHRLIRQAEGLAALRDAPEGADALPDATTAVAAFEGRRTVFPLCIEGAPVSMTVLDGVLRAVTAERPATRLILAGAEAPVLSLALSLAESLTLAVPTRSLAADALCLADGTTAPPRRSGAPSLPHDGFSVREAFGHILGHLTDVMLYLAPIVADPDTGPEPVHQLRVAVRRARSALSVFPPVEDNPSLTRAAIGLKQLGRILGPARDWDVFMTETVPPVEAALPDHAGLHVLLRAGARRRQAARATLDAYLSSPGFRVLTIELACFAAGAAPAEVPVTDARRLDNPLLRDILTQGGRAGHADADRDDLRADRGDLKKVGADAASAEPVGADAAASEAGVAALGRTPAEWAEPVPASPGQDMPSPTLAEFAASVLRKRWKRLRNVGKALEGLDDSALHGLRLKAKRLRYAAEFFAPLFPQKPTARFIRRLAVLQERLGLFNDTTVAQALLRELNTKPGYAAGLVLGFTAARGARARPKIAAAWARFRRRDPFWSV